MWISCMAVHVVAKSTIDKHTLEQPYFISKSLKDNTLESKKNLRMMFLSGKLRRL